MDVSTLAIALGYTKKQVEQAKRDRTDYVLTPQDKSDIAAIVLSELPTTQGVQYGNTSN